MVALKELIDGYLASYGQIFFRGSRTVGALLALATFTEPHLGLFGTISVVIALATAKLARLNASLIRDGLYSYSALLTGLAIGATFGTDSNALGLMVIAANVTVPVTAATHSGLGGSLALPPLTIPFLVTTYLSFGAGEVLGLESNFGANLAVMDGVAGTGLAYLSSLAGIFFVSSPIAGVLVMVAIVVYSRIAFALSCVGFALAIALHTIVGLPSLSYAALGYNFILTSVALGGVWFVPSRSSFMLATAGVVVCGLFTTGATPFLERAGMPLLVLPFNITVLLILYAMRQRTLDASPKAVDFALGSPEENLGYYRTRLLRFGANCVVRLRAPFSGNWTCTQGIDGAFTHQGPWRYAFDFEVRAADGKFHTGRGLSLGEYHAYKLPVLAPAIGTVVTVVDGIPDNPVGRPNLKENWGNVVVIQHALGVYSLLCHLAPGSVTVKTGQVVRQGEKIGACGNSGRSSVPHLHFHLQALPQPGAPTIHTELHDVVVGGERGGNLVATCLPNEGEDIRNVRPDPQMERFLPLRYGECFQLSLEGRTPERLRPDFDLYGNRVIHSEDTGAQLFYSVEGGLFTVFDVLGSRRSVLHLMQAALSRVPFEAGDEIDWDDQLFSFRLPGTSWLRSDTVRMRYTKKTTPQGVMIEGRSERLSTRAVLEHGTGIATIEASHRRGTIRACRVPLPNLANPQEVNPACLPARSLSSF